MPTITETEFSQHAHTLLGFTVRRVKNSFGSALYLKLGAPDLLPPTVLDQTVAATVSVYWDWRLEDTCTILCGSSNRRSEFKLILEQLVGLTITELSLEIPLPDLTVGFSNGWRLRSMSLVAGDPQWHIDLPDNSTLRGRGGRLVHSLKPVLENYHPDPLADRTSDIAMAANQRWLRHNSTPAKQNCKDCQFFVPLDGPSAYLWYGVCACGESQFDGKVVHQNARCAEFCPN
jgi:hypothetical protein